MLGVANGDLNIFMTYYQLCIFYLLLFSFFRFFYQQHITNKISSCHHACRFLCELNLNLTTSTIQLLKFECIYLTNRFHVAVRVFSNRSQMTSKCRKNKEVAHEPQASVSLLFLPHFDVLCDLLLNRPTATWNLFVLCNDQKRKRPIHIPASNRLTF